MQDKNISEELARLLDKAKERDRRSFRNTIIYSLVPIILGFTLIIFTGKVVSNAYKNLEATKRMADSLKEQISELYKHRDTLKINIDELKDSLKIYKNRVSLEQRRLKPLIAQRERMERLVAEMYRLIFPLKDMEIITRSKAESLFINYSQSTNPNDRKASTLWDIIYKMIGHRPIPNIFWELDGISEDETKFSPSGFIAYILQKAGKLNISIDSLKRCDDSKLREILINCSKEVHFSAVQSGDIVFYPSGNVMIYFNNYGKPGKSVCVGMTPIGLIAVNPHFEMRMKNGLRRIPED